MANVSDVEMVQLRINNAKNVYVKMRVRLWIITIIVYVIQITIGILTLIQVDVYDVNKSIQVHLKNTGIDQVKNV